MSDLPFGIETKTTYAALSPADLQSLGKRACAAYLSGEASLNDAIIKLARENPSISPHQVQRVIEFANQETFSRLFSDGEKNAADKNIEFPVADPSVILLELNNGAKPQIMTAPPDDYSCSPVKLGHSSVEADIELTRMFLGVDPASPEMDKTSSAVGHFNDAGSFVVDRVLALDKKADAEVDLLDRVLSLGKEKTALGNMIPTGAPVPAQPPMGLGAGPGPTPPPDGQVQELGADGQPIMSSEQHHEKMLEIQREIELAKKQQELQKVRQQTLDQMHQASLMGGMPAPAPGDPAAGDPNAAAGMGGGAPPEGGGAPAEAAPPQEAQPPAPPMEGAITVPPGSEMPKTSSLIDRALEYVKTARPHSRLVVDDLIRSVSLDSIRKTAARVEKSYPMANPYGDLIRTKQGLDRLLDDATYAKDKCADLHKEATVRFEKALVQHLYDGGNLGEVAHLMSAVHGSPVGVKEVLATAMPYLLKQGLDPVEAQAEAIQYEMFKGASARVPNLQHPIAEAYADLHKISEANIVLGRAWSTIKQKCDEVNSVLKEAMLNASAR